MQAGYEWLWKEPAPKELLEALKLFGTKEVPGKGNNPEIMAWAKEVHTTYPGDDLAWCGLFRSIVAKRSGWDYYPNGNALWARNWASWGTSIAKDGAMLGDTLVFSRTGGGGHVGLYVGEDKTHFHVLGGNQSDTVNISRIAKDRLIAVRRAPWKIAQPQNVHKVWLSAKGAPTTTNEA